MPHTFNIHSALRPLGTKYTIASGWHEVTLDQFARLGNDTDTLLSVLSELPEKYIKLSLPAQKKALCDKFLFWTESIATLLSMEPSDEMEQRFTPFALQTYGQKETFLVELKRVFSAEKWEEPPYLTAIMLYPLDEKWDEKAPRKQAEQYKEMKVKEFFLLYLTYMASLERFIKPYAELFVPQAGDPRLSGLMAKVNALGQFNLIAELAADNIFAQLEVPQLKLGHIYNHLLRNKRMRDVQTRVHELAMGK